VSKSAERDAKVEQERKHFEKCREIHRRVFDHMREYQVLEAEARELLESARGAYSDALYAGETF
jgi:hypothetical protein